MEYFALGAGLGFAAGISPGPLQTLVLTSTLERGFGAGLRVALAPVLTDAPIILLSVALLHRLPPTFLRAITVAGGLFVIYLAVTTLRRATRSVSLEVASGGDRRDLGRGVLVNLLSPHPWIFWVTVGTPILLRAWHQGPQPAIGFLLAFFALIVGCKIVLAALVTSGRGHLTGAWYGRVLAASGLLLLAMGAVLLRHGVTGPA